MFTTFSSALQYIIECIICFTSVLGPDKALKFLGKHLLFMRLRLSVIKENLPSLTLIRQGIHNCFYNVTNALITFWTQIKSDM